MSSIICFDIRNFSTHVSHLPSNKNDIIINLIKNIFESLERAIDESREYCGISGKTFINHTGDGFITIFYDNDRSLQSLFVASLLAKDVDELLKEYNKLIEKETKLKYLDSLGYGIGIHLGGIAKFEYNPEYPKSHQISGFLGNAINVSHRVQESTKDHKFRVICTKLLYINAIKRIKDDHKTIFVECFTELDRHNLRGMSGPYNLYGVSIDFAEKIKLNMIKKSGNQKKGS